MQIFGGPFAFLQAFITIVSGFGNEPAFEARNLLSKDFPEQMIKKCSRPPTASKVASYRNAIFRKFVFDISSWRKKLSANERKQEHLSSGRHARNSFRKIRKF